MAARIRVEVARDFADLEALTDGWRRLWHQSRRREIFSTFSWARAWWRVYGRHRTLCTPLLYEGDTVVGILPIVAHGRTLRFLGMPGADYNDLLCATGAGAGLLESALSALADLPLLWSECILENVSEHSEIVNQFHELSGKLRSRLQLSARTPCPAVILGADRDQVMSGILSKKRTRDNQARLQRLGELSFRHLEDREEIRRHLPRFFEQHRARSALACQTSLFCEGDHRRFYYALVDELEPGRELRFSVLELGGKPIAYHLGFELNGKFILYKPTFDVDFWDHSPGLVLIGKLFEYVASREVREFDFTGGGELYKERFANRVHHNYTLNFYASGNRGRALHAYHRAKERLKEEPRAFLPMKSSKTGLERLFSRLRRAVNRYGVLGLTRGALARALGAAVYARDEVLIFAREKEPAEDMDDPAAGTSEKISLRPATLSELASLSVEDSGFLDAARLHTMRARLKRGDVVYLAREGEGLARMAWMGIREDVVTVGDEGERFAVELKEPVRLIFDWSSPPNVRGRDALASVLTAMVRIAPTEPRPIWIGCRTKDVESRRAIEKAGFQLRHRVGRLQLFHWFSRTW